MCEMDSPWPGVPILKLLSNPHRLHPIRFDFCPRLSVPGTKPGSCMFGVKKVAYSLRIDRVQDYCANYFHGNLVPITNDDENLRVLLMTRNFISSDFYFRGAPPSAWIGGYWDGQNVKFQDGTISNYTNFDQPWYVNYTGNIAMFIDNGKWGIVLDADYSVCQTDRKRDPCPRDSVQSLVNDDCFFAIPLTLNYYGGQQYCKDYFDGNLASITNAFDNQAVLQMTTDVLRSFQAFNTEAWIGGLYNGNEVIWEDGNPSVYNNLRKGNYTEYSNTYLILIDGTWVAGSVYSFDNSPFICSVKRAASHV
ncbi:unnamed protein product, partial [Mesorhabditis belari]|uniref:C-type lectin domain-containing protein n=1 Tax=Mesorhabditis belari TaxID=2138241 RepID=A0AAF3EN95_9BILA